MEGSDPRLQPLQGVLPAGGAWYPVVEQAQTDSGEGPECWGSGSGPLPPVRWAERVPWRWQTPWMGGGEEGPRPGCGARGCCGSGRAAGSCDLADSSD